jgi:dUTP pyrophosphatase
LFRTGIAVQPEKGFEIQIRPRSGLALKKGITVLNSPATIEPTYRGDVR